MKLASKQRNRAKGYSYNEIIFFQSSLNRFQWTSVEQMISFKVGWKMNVLISYQKQTPISMKIEGCIHLLLKNGGFDLLIC